MAFVVSSCLAPAHTSQPLSVNSWVVGGCALTARDAIMDAEFWFI